MVNGGSGEWEKVGSGSEILLCVLCAFFVSFVVKTTWKFGVRYSILDSENRNEKGVEVKKFIKEKYPLQWP
jgi:hypothetical protein